MLKGVGPLEGYQQLFLAENTFPEKSRIFIENKSTPPPNRGRWRRVALLLGQALLDFRSNGVNFRANGLVSAAALLLGHELGIIDGGVYFL